MFGNFEIKSESLVLLLFMNDLFGCIWYYYDVTVSMTSFINAPYMIKK